MTITTGPKCDGFQAAIIKSHLKLMKIGMKASKGFTQKKLMKLAGNITNKTYKRGLFDEAIYDLQGVVDKHIEHIELINAVHD